MPAYTVLLVDDEEEVIRIISKKIPWEELGFHILGYALNGVKALEMAEEMQPDVVMTDIRMPYMDGLELSEKLKKEYPTIHILLFTGFDEFEYAKTAIHLEVDDYVLKPVNAEELTRIFTKLKKNLDEERREQKNIENLQEYYLKTLPMVQSDYFASILDGRPVDEKSGEILKQSMDSPYFAVAVIHTSAHQVPPDIDPVYLPIAVRKQAEENLGEKWSAHFLYYRGDTVMIAQLPTPEDVTVLTDDCDRMARSVKHVIGAVVTIGIGAVCHALTEIQSSYNGAREAVSYRVLYGTVRAINIREIAPTEDTSVPYSDNETLRELFKQIHMGNQEDIEKAVHAYVESTLKTVSTVEQYRIQVMALVAEFYRFAANNHISHNEVNPVEEDLYRELSGVDADAVEKWMTENAVKFHDALARARKDTSRSFVEEAKEYVEDHYQEPELSLDQVCNALGVSNSYFSSAFKKETGTPFISYLTQYRMQKAEQLLLSTKEKNYAIARSVGYQDANYFSYVFKKQFGMSPSRYRTQHAKENSGERV